MKYISVVIFLVFTLFTAKAELKSVYQLKTVVIDAGHGGKDPGAIGKISSEKDVVLKVALALGNSIKKNMPEVKVIYTRSKDEFIELNKRAEIANKSKADLFISIHANSLQRSNVYGAETYILGLHRSADNLAVAKMENSVITYEDDYSQKYEGFDPQSSESYIIFNFMQNKYLDQSLQIAQLVQDNFRISAGRTDRGVRQAGFLVLRNTSMPSILVEIGYMSNPNEEKYLNTIKGQNYLAASIYKAFKEYKTEIERKSILEVTTVATPNSELSKRQDSMNNKVMPGIVYKVQIFSTNEKLDKKAIEMKRYSDLSYYKSNSRYRYMVGKCTTYQEAIDLKNKMQEVYKDAFIVVFNGSKKISVKEAMKKLEKTK